MNQIKHRYNGETIIARSDTKTIGQLASEFYKNLNYADLSGADLRGADLSCADLRDANLSSADLSGADLSCADLRRADLRGADLRGADLHGADLRRADLRGADLRGADLSCADLHGADLSCADLRDANLSSADLSGADLSGAKGLLNAAEFLAKFEQDELGLIVYKRIGANTTYSLATHWKIKKGAILTEVPNPTRTQECGCGVNFGTLEWCERNYSSAVLWKCRIRWIDLADVCVPYNTDGKARCAKLELIEKVK